MSAVSAVSAVSAPSHWSQNSARKETHSNFTADVDDVDSRRPQATEVQCIYPLEISAPKLTFVTSCDN